MKAAFKMLKMELLCQLIPGLKILAVYGEGAVNDRTSQKWFAIFHA